MKLQLHKKNYGLSFLWMLLLFSVLGQAQTPAPTTIFPNQVYAGNSATVGQLVVSASGSLKFYTVPTGGTAIPISTLMVDNTTYYLSQTVLGVESTSRVAIKVRRISESTQTVNAPATVANLASTPSAGATARWYNVAGGGSPLVSTTTLATGNYYVDQSIPASISTIASGFSTPYGLAVQSNGKILVSEANGGVIKRMDADGTNSVTLISGLNGPYAIAIQADGKFVFAESGAGVTPTAIKRANADGTGIQTLYTGDASQEFFAVAVQADGKILFSDQSYIYRINADGSGFTTLTLANDVLGPQGLCVESTGKILIADTFNGAIKRMDADGTNVTTLVSGLSFPQSVAVLSNGKIVVTELMGSKVITYNTDGTNPTIIGNTPNFTNPSGLAIINDANILVADTDSNTVKLIADASFTNRALVAVTVIPTAPTTNWTKQIYTGVKTLSNLQVTGINIKWYATPSGGTALNVANNLTSGTTYYATQTISNVESTSRLAITVNKISENSQVVPPNSTLTAIVTTPSAGATAQWYTAASGGTMLPDNYVLTTGNLYVEENASGVISNRVAVTIGVAPAPPTTTFPIQIYKGDTNTLASLQVTGIGVKWYTTASGGSAIPNTTLLTDNATYYTTQTVNFIESLTRTPITVKRISDATQSLPAGSTVANLVANTSSGTSARWFTVASGGTALNSTDAISTGTYYVEQFNPVTNRIPISVTVAVLGTTSFENFAYKMYPNPTSGVLHFEIEEDATLTVFTITGNKIAEAKYNLSNNSIDLSNYNSGVYLVSMVTESGKSKTIRVVKQ